MKCSKTMINDIKVKIFCYRLSHWVQRWQQMCDLNMTSVVKERNQPHSKVIHCVLTSGWGRLMVSIYVFTQPLHHEQDVTQGQFLSKTDLNSKFSFSKTNLTKFALLFTHSWGEKRWIHAFFKGINIKWNADSLDQDLNLSCQFHFLKWWSLYQVQLDGFSIIK